jgi:hypothetical protein
LQPCSLQRAAAFHAAPRRSSPDPGRSTPRQGRSGAGSLPDHGRQRPQCSPCRSDQHVLSRRAHRRDRDTTAAKVGGRTNGAPLVAGPLDITAQTSVAPAGRTRSSRRPLEPSRPGDGIPAGFPPRRTKRSLLHPRPDAAPQIRHLGDVTPGPNPDAGPLHGPGPARPSLSGFDQGHLPQAAFRERAQGEPRPRGSGVPGGFGDKPRTPHPPLCSFLGPSRTKTVSAMRTLRLSS